MKFLIITAIVLSAMPSIARKTVSLNTAQSLQETIEKAGANTTFLLKAGKYSAINVTPTEGQQFIGENGTVWDGNGQQYAIRGSVGNVVIKNIEFTGYNPPQQMGVINSVPRNDGLTHGAHHWTIEDCEFHHNGGAAIAVGNDFIVRNNYIHHQEQIGIVFGGSNSLIEGNEIAFWNCRGQRGHVVEDVHPASQYGHVRREYLL